jgi:hypothetical protein
MPLITLSGFGLVTVKLRARRYNVLPTRMSCCGCALPCSKHATHTAQQLQHIHTQTMHLHKSQPTMPDAQEQLQRSAPRP